MKRLWVWALVLVMLLSACGQSSVGIIGGADGPTEIVVAPSGE